MNASNDLKKNDNIGDVIIVARYKENIEWLESSDLAKISIIYNKGDDLNIGHHKFKKVVPLENIGREAHTYLYHIVDYLRSFQKLHNKNAIESDKNDHQHVHVFVQGNITDHIPKDFRKGRECDYVKMLMEEARIHGISSNHGKHNFGINSAQENFKIKVHTFGQKLFDSGMTFGEWFRQYVDNKFEREVQKDDISWYVGGIFAVRNDVLVNSRELEYYEKLLECVSTDNNPETAHFLERSWHYIFTPSS